MEIHCNFCSKLLLKSNEIEYFILRGAYCNKKCEISHSNLKIKIQERKNKPKIDITLMFSQVNGRNSNNFTSSTTSSNFDKI